jgi:hypothetical protein
MKEKSDIPEGWAIPDDLANEISEELSKKRITPEEMLQDVLSDIARDIALIEPEPQDWGWWVGYLLEQMEMQAEKHRLTKQYEYTLEVLVEKIQKRIKGGKW